MTTSYVESVPEGQDAERIIQNMARKHYDIIFATSFGYMDSMLNVAEQFPNSTFMHCSGYKTAPNMSNYFGRIYQARYLSGIVAGMNTESDKIGYVAAMGQDNAEVTGGIDAFAMGVYSVNPEAKVFVKVTNSWFAPEMENAAAEALLAEGCDVIAQHCDTTAPQLAAQEKGVWGCGYNSDMTVQAPDAHLTAPIWNWDVYYKLAIETAMNTPSEFMSKVGIYYGGLKEGLVDISPLSDNCAEGTQEIIDEVKAMTCWEAIFSRLFLP